MLRAVRAGAPDGAPELRVAILRNVTVDTIVPYLQYLALHAGVRAEISMGDYDTVMADVLDASSRLYAFRPELVLLCLKLETLAPRLVTGFSGLGPAEAAAETDRVVREVERILQALRAHTEAMVVLTTFEIPVYPALGVMDYQSPQHQINTLRRLNASILDVVAKHKNVFVLDTNLLLAELGAAQFSDARYWHMAKAPYSRTALRRMAEETFRFVRARLGRAKKCLVLDADNTLWGGIVGEDGMAGIKIGQTYPGSCYRAFQQAALELYHRGVFLALCSKNNEADVLEVLDGHPDMLLRREHFSCIEVNWGDKATSLRKIAETLNIGTDALVFVDDNPAELALVNQLLPEVATLQVPAELVHYETLLPRAGLFDTLTLSEEDRGRNQMFRAEVQRRELQSEIGDLQDYFRSLEMRVRIDAPNEVSLPRIAQLTQKTNQFNLTTPRYTEETLRRLIEGGHDVIQARLEDRFGDTGIIGVAIVRYDAEATLDTFLMSCRVIGRGVEDLLLRTCVERARARGKTTLHGEYRPTKKNAQVADFLPSRGFAPAGSTDSAQRYALDVARDVAVPDYFRAVEICLP